MPRESPWEPVPPEVAAKLTATAEQNKLTSTPPGEVSAHLNEPFKLKIGQIATILDTPERFGVKFHSVKQDSRCPKQVNCAETGQVSLVLQPLQDSIELPPLVTVTLNPALPDQARADLGGYQVQLANVEPHPEQDWAEKEIAPDAYVATLIVSPAIPRVTPLAAATTTPIATPTTVPPTVPITTAVPVTPTTPISPTGLTVRLNEPFTLPLSHWATLPEANNMRVIFTTLRDDRCPTKVNCAQAGSASVLITVESGGKLARFDLSSSPPDHRGQGTFNGYRVEFISLDPIPEQLHEKIPLNEYRVTLRISAGSFDAAQARAGQPFALKLGQTAALADAQVQVTFEAVQQDSRCPVHAACATSGQAKVVITLQYENKTDRLTLTANPDFADWFDPAPDSPAVFLNALTPYPQNEFASKEIVPNEYEATFVVVPPAQRVTPAPQTTLTPPQLAGCPALTRGDAAEILGEAVKETPAELYFFQRADDAIPMHGLCGYGSVAFTPNQPTPEDTPDIFPEMISSDHAVIADQLIDSKRQEQLVSLASALNTEAASGDAAVLYPKMLTFYAAGAWFNDMLGDFVTAGPDLTNVRIDRVEGLGDSAIWVWREFAGGRYAALVAQKGETLFVVAALTSDQRAEDGARIAMTGVMKKMLE